jgi:endonuclease YncB( thermonuclease family)
MLRIAALLVLLSTSATSAEPINDATNITGQASIIDGDTLEIHGTRIRLWGIDAPEMTNFAGGMIACNTNVEHEQQTLSTTTLLVTRLRVSSGR